MKRNFILTGLAFMIAGFFYMQYSRRGCELDLS